ncbi:hypothetical protein HII31_11738 [Pseudocercospora fuligena]|uniref:Uncharacterized protein n=1 Tax=Pseudocercospora fuligena TaxID=685502 RepID=A0A8H6VG72_9PEZI|nr:hypothetical protein HII31_11738 [Pseudocercospora fuligena]
MRTEQIIFEAREAGRMKARCDSDNESRRPSITIDDNGMVIQRGFLAPVSRSSSQNSLARTLTNSSASSSFNAEFITPATSFESPGPGYSRPTGSLYHAPEFRRLRNESATSLLLPVQHPPLEVVWKPRPGMGERRQTWQSASKRVSQSSPNSYKGAEGGLEMSQHEAILTAQKMVQRVSQSIPSSYKDDNGLEISKNPTAFGAKRAVPRVASPAASLLSDSLMETKMKQTAKAQRRSAPEALMERNGMCRDEVSQRSVPGSITGRATAFGGREQQTSPVPKNDQPQLKQKQAGDAEDEDAAIASDSEDDFIDESDVAIMRNRNCYAERRALNDARA